MPDLIAALKSGPLLADGATGSYLLELTGRLEEGRFVYESLNVSSPDLIKGVHLAYLQAGAQCLTTNTFSANSVSLAAAGLAEQTAELNRAGVRLAQEAIGDFKAQTGLGGDFFVLGSVGPSPAGARQAAGERSSYREQIEALSAAGADAILFETFQSFAQVRPALDAAMSIRGAPPVILHLALQHRLDKWSEEPAKFVAEAMSLGVKVIGVNCCAPWEAGAFVDAVKDLPEVRSGQVLLSAMPNAGGFERIGHRFLSRVNPEFMGRLARTMSDKGVRLIGGCCEVHPPHIAEMRNFLQPARAGSLAGSAANIRGRSPAGPAEKSENGRFSKKLFRGEFVVSVEVVPPRGTGPRTLDDKAEFIRQVADSGLADAVDFTDGSRGIPLMPPGDFAAVVREKLGWTAATGDRLEIIPHFAARDLNTMGLQSRLMGYHARGIHNVLFITGDPPKMSPTYPRSTAVFDLDSVTMVRYANAFLNSGMDFGGQPLGRHSDPRTRFTVGSGVEPEAVNMEREMEKLRRKVEAGADYIFTQPVYRDDALRSVEPFRNHVRICVGVMVLDSLDHAKRLAQVPGVVMPEAVIERLARFEKPEDQAKAGIELAIAQARRVRKDGWAGLYLISPGAHAPVIEVLRAGMS